MEGVQESGVHVLYFLGDGLVVWTVEPPVSDHTKYQAKAQVILLNVCVTQHNMGNAPVNWNPHPPDPGQIGEIGEGPYQIILQNP